MKRKAKIMQKKGKFSKYSTVPVVENRYRKSDGKKEEEKLDIFNLYKGLREFIKHYDSYYLRSLLFISKDGSIEDRKQFYGFLDLFRDEMEFRDSYIGDPMEAGFQSIDFDDLLDEILDDFLDEMDDRMDDTDDLDDPDLDLRK